MNVLEVLIGKRKKKTVSLEFYIQQKKYTSMKAKYFSDKRKLRKLVTSRPAPQECWRKIVSLKRSDSKWKHLGRIKNMKNGTNLLNIKDFFHLNFFQTCMNIQSKILVHCLVVFIACRLICHTQEMLYVTVT